VWGKGRSQQYTVADKTHSDHVPGTAAAAAADAAVTVVVVVVAAAADIAVVVAVVNLSSISNKMVVYHTFTHLRSPLVGFDIDFDHIHFEAPPGPPALLAPRCHLPLVSLYFAYSRGHRCYY
jgi:hypothetical protein